MTDNKSVINKLKTISAVSNKNIDHRYLMYAIELLQEITSDKLEPINSFEWLYSVKEFSPFERNTDTIIELLNIFENIIDSNKEPELKPEIVNRLISQLVIL